MAVTLNDIAKKAGVSKTTVSRVLNKKESVIPISPGTKEKVLKASNELNYRPNVHARALSTKKSYMLGLIVDYLDPFYNDLIQGSEKYSRSNNYNLILSIVNDKPIDKIIDVLLFRSAVEGIIICGTKKLIKDKTIVDELSKKDVPVVLLSHYLEGVPKVVINNFEGGYMATNYLINLGYDNIGIITGSDIKTRKDSKERLMGYKKALKEKNIKIKKENIINGDFTYESGYNAIKKFLKLNSMPKAIFACDDQMALGALSAVNEFNIKVPDELSIIGFDNIVQTNYSYPKLTTIAQPRIEMGEYATKLLINLIEKDEIIKKEKVFSPRLIERDSCKKTN